MVNKKSETNLMKNSTYDIKFFEANIYHQRFGQKKHFFNNMKVDTTIMAKFNSYLISFYNFCFELDYNNMLKEDINFKHEQLWQYQNEKHPNPEETKEDLIIESQRLI